MITEKNISSQTGLSEKKSNEVVEINLGEIAALFKKYFLLLAIVTLVAMVLGYAFSFLFTKTYKSEISLLTEYNSSKLGPLAGLSASLGTVSGAENLSPDLYPEVLSSYPFGIFLLNQPVMDEAGKTHTTFRKFNESRRSDTSIFSFFNSSSDKTLKTPVKLSNSDILNFSAPEEQLIKSALSVVTSAYETKSRVLTISATTADPVVSAYIADAAKNYMIQYMEDYGTNKSSIQVKFLSGQVIEASKRHRRAEYNLQSYRDRNRNPFLNVARIEEQRLQTEFNLAEALHLDLIRKLEDAKLKVKEQKPVFKVLEPAKVPLSKVSPKRPIFILVFGFLGALGAMIFILIRRNKR